MYVPWPWGQRQFPKTVVSDYSLWKSSSPWCWSLSHYSRVIASWLILSAWVCLFTLPRHSCDPTELHWTVSRFWGKLQIGLGLLMILSYFLFICFVRWLAIPQTIHLLPLPLLIVFQNLPSWYKDTEWISWLDFLNKFNLLAYPCLKEFHPYHWCLYYWLSSASAYWPVNQQFISPLCTPPSKTFSFTLRCLCNS